ncbi:MAG: methyltransferase domain-containing protein [Bacteroidetes bacterium]|nr:methyltransferase domain-containing protein [Bacteroidota bacterium]
MFRNRLEKVNRHLSKLARRKNIEAYRIYDHDLPEFPFCVERYGSHICLSEYKRKHGMDPDFHSSWMQACLQIINAVLQVPLENIHSRVRQRKLGRQGQYQKSEREEENEFFKIAENGLWFWVNLDEYLDTGLFLDHRDTRQLVREQCAQKRMLNLFAYTGSFSVYAAAGGASLVTTVDLSNTYLDWAKRNMQSNGFEGPAYQFERADVKQWLEQLPANSYDVIVMDPPTFSNSKRMNDVLDLQVDHVQLIRACIRSLSPTGVLFFSTNYRGFRLDAEALSDLNVKDITRLTTPFDFEGKLNRLCFSIRP